MNFNNLIELAQENKNNPTKVKGFSTVVTPAKKPPRSNVPSAAVQKFLQKREEMERNKEKEAIKQREKLLSLRAQNSKSSKAAKLMSSRTKDNDFSRIRLTEDEVEAKQKVEAKIRHQRLTDTVERMKARIKLEEIEHQQPHKRKRKRHSDGTPIDAKPFEKDWDTIPKTKDHNVISNKPRKNVTHPLSFNELLKIAQTKQNESEDSVPEEEPEERLMTKKERFKLLEERAHEERSEKYRNIENNVKTSQVKPAMKRIPKKSDSSTPRTANEIPHSSQSTPTIPSYSSIRNPLPYNPKMKENNLKVPSYNTKPGINSKTISSIKSPNQSQPPPPPPTPYPQVPSYNTKKKVSENEKARSVNAGKSIPAPNRSTPIKKEIKNSVVTRISIEERNAAYAAQVAKAKEMRAQKKLTAQNRANARKAPLNQPSKANNPAKPHTNGKISNQTHLPVKTEKIVEDSSFLSKPGVSSQAPTKPGGPSRPRPMGEQIKAHSKNENSSDNIREMARPSSKHPFGQRPVGGPLKPAGGPGRPVNGPIRPANGLGGSVRLVNGPERPVSDSGKLINGPGRPGVGPGRPGSGPGRPFDGPGRPGSGPGRPFDGPGRPFDGPRRPGPVQRPLDKKPIMQNRQEPFSSKNFARNPYKKLPPISSSRSVPQIESDYDEEEDEDMCDFIDDGPINDGEDYSQHIRDIFGYDKRKYMFDDDFDDEAMESSFTQQMKEEIQSARIGLLEDLEDIRKEAEEMKRKQKRMKKS